MKTSSMLANSSIFRVFVSWYRIHRTLTRGANVTDEEKYEYITHVNTMRKLPLGSVVVTKQEEDSGSTFSQSGSIEVAREEDVGSAAR